MPPPDGMMGGGDSDDSEEEKEELIMAPYNNRTKGIFMIFAALPPRRFFRRLDNYLREKDIKSVHSATHW